jgi:transcriptional regulator with XRE-family HTH domain
VEGLTQHQGVDDSDFDFAWWSRALRQLRRRYDLSQRQLAALSGLPSSTIGDLEAGRVVPSVRTLERVFAGLGYRLELVDAGGDPLQWSSADDAHPRDAAGRRFPAHLDVRPRYLHRAGREPSPAWPGTPWTYHVDRSRRDVLRLTGRFGLWGAGPPIPGCFDGDYTRLHLPDGGRELIERVEAAERHEVRVALSLPVLRQPSHRSHNVPSGGSRSRVEAGRPCQPSACAVTPPRLPTPDPP